jgi:hypothetical protein
VNRGVPATRPIALVVRSERFHEHPVGELTSPGLSNPFQCSCDQPPSRYPG